MYICTSSTQNRRPQIAVQHIGPKSTVDYQSTQISVAVKPLNPKLAVKSETPKLLNPKRRQQEGFHLVFGVQQR